jgi:hypothetical protein
MILKEPFSMKQYLENGFWASEINDEMAQKLLATVKSEHMLQMEMETYEDGTSKRAFKQRYMAKRSFFQPQSERPIYTELKNGLGDELERLLELYKNGMDPDCRMLAPFLGMPGYMMAMHSDAGDRAAAVVIVYLSDQRFDETTGGELAVYRCLLDDNMEEVEHSEVGRIYPNNGAVVVINPSALQIKHGVRPVKEGNHKRYSLLMTFGTTDIPRWCVNFNEVPGKIENSMYSASGEPDPEY